MIGPSTPRLKVGLIVALPLGRAFRRIAVCLLDSVRPCPLPCPDLVTILPVRRVLPVIMLLLAVLAFAPLLRAQVDEDYTGNTPGPAQIPSRAANPGRGSGEVRLVVRSFGLGNAARPGEWVGVLVEVSDNSDKVRNVIVRIIAPDLDGDDALMQRVIVTNPGAAQRVWLYMRLRFGDVSGVEFDLTASEAVASGTGEGDAQQYSPGRLLGTLRYSVGANTAMRMGVGMLPVVGNHASGLEQYTWVPDSPGPDPKYALTAHEFTHVGAGIPLLGLPDRWQGYSGITALAWTSAASEDNPLNLRKDQADAIREYVKRGGHFVIVLPNVGQSWLAQPNNPLADIMPAAKVTRTEGVSLEKYRSLLTSDPEVVYPPESVVHSFTPEGTTWPADTYPIMIGPDGEAVVLRRIVGAGMVSVVGFDLASIKLQQRTRAFMAERFWNRVLGKRMRVPTPAEVAAGRKGQTSTGFPTSKDAESYEWNAQSNEIDRSVVAAVNNEGTAAVGLLLAFVVFAGYWLLAGPVGYFLLKQRNWKHHAWVAFMLATAAFTAVSWGGASLLKGRRISGHHLTIVDCVYGQPMQKARAWIGLILPKYGEQEVALAPSTGSGAEWHNLIAAWENPSVTGGTGWSTFPDARPYVVDCRTPDTIRFPARATTKQVQMDWAGALPEGWVMPHPLADPSVPVGKEIRIAPVADPKAKRSWTIEGQVVHNLPAPLKNVWVTVVRRPIDRSNLAPVELQCEAYMGRTQGDWKPGEPLSLDAVFPTPLGIADRADTKLGELVPRPSQTGFPGDYRSDMMARAISFMDIAGPADPVKGQTYATRSLLVRQCTHGLDLSRWFTQPCIIIIGELGSNDRADEAQVECPLPIRVDSLPPSDARKRLTGRTIVRWIYPLDAAPFRAVPVAAPANQPDDLDKLLDKQSPKG